VSTTADTGLANDSASFEYTAGRRPRRFRPAKEKMYPAAGVFLQNTPARVSMI
jgi:hypothetical protein